MQTSYNIFYAVPSRASAILKNINSRYTGEEDGFLDVFSEGVTCGPADRANHGTGAALEFQKLSKDKPAFSIELAAAGLRHRADHWGPIDRKEVTLSRDVDQLLRKIQYIVDSE